MRSTSYSLQQADINALVQVIIIDGTNTRVQVIDITRRIFNPNQDELQFYARVNDRRIVFETINWPETDFVLITEAIRWYANHTGHPGLQFEVVPPTR